MKLPIISAFYTLLYTAAFAQQGYRLEVTLRNMQHKKLLLAYQQGSRLVLDSNALLQNGSYVFTGQVQQPQVATLIVRSPQLNIPLPGMGFIPAPGLPLVLSNTAIRVTGDAAEVYMASVQDQSFNREWQHLRRQEAQLTDKDWQSTRQAYAAGNDTAALRRSIAYRGQLQEEKKELYKQFIRQHPASFISIYLLSQLLNDLPPEALEKSYASLAATHKQSMYGLEIAEKISGLKATATGQTAPGFTFPDSKGQPFSLSSLRGKYVLLDFWGSWCGPCREGHPHLKKLYEKYRPAGLEIVGIAYEQRRTAAEKKAAWLKAVEQDGLNWIQVLCNGQEQPLFDVVKAYGVTAFPTRLLLDREGKILARFTGDEAELEQRLAQLMNH